MAEIIGLTASLITLAGLGTKLAKTLRDATDALNSADHEAHLIAADISIFASSLVQLSKTLPMVANYDIPEAEKLLEVTEVLVLACSSLVDELQRYIGDPVVLRMKGGMWMRALGWHFKWFFQMAKVAFVKRLMESFKSTLVFLVPTMDLAVGIQQDAQHEVR
ncbi:hypothetical protein DM02DRAFT_429900 [Periconia macrospinosa]|uniref:Fungal N-terminal domain-containing protein n=1 Tax=Periconia macrospinosa TaxID=97972 RepID=A0A2V1CXY1_9PLEO|nr:hypothetical protein DM02DRAFT_429900 [Periconia macrospinosa]